MLKALDAKRRRSGAPACAFSTEPVDLTDAALRCEAHAALPAARLPPYEPVNDDKARAGARLAFGRPLLVHTQLESQSDPGARLRLPVTETGSVLAGRQFAAGRKMQLATAGAPNRLYVVE